MSTIPSRSHASGWILGLAVAGGVALMAAAGPAHAADRGQANPGAPGLGASGPLNGRWVPVRGPYEDGKDRGNPYAQPYTQPYTAPPGTYYVPQPTPSLPPGTYYVPAPTPTPSPPPGVYVVPPPTQNPPGGYYVVPAQPRGYQPWPVRVTSADCAQLVPGWGRGQPPSFARGESFTITLGMDPDGDGSSLSWRSTPPNVALGLHINGVSGELSVDGRRVPDREAARVYDACLAHGARWR
ncbi:hypothetical protein [Pararhodospirillum oryzae]|uniref:Uncharacterized protein n=1 Tax=Pararhodospirillum oryzae TaxID=478448 RepID=A0A512H535_9PROT|nr:hypothetical protein [Pararhodospirillum oryzae]GEO80579.1 hypothetical protein ROR02_07100 [Pararhodospirillum oryzae]